MKNLNKNLNHDHVNAVFDYDYIVDGIYIGNNQCCHLGLDILLKQQEIHTVLSLEENVVDNPLGVKSFLWLPVVNHTPPDKEQMELGVNFIEQIVNLKKKIYVHCKNGHGRGPTIVIAFFIKKQGMSFQQAYNLVKEKRPSMHLDENQVTFLKDIQIKKT